MRASKYPDQRGRPWFVSISPFANCSSALKCLPVIFDDVDAVYDDLSTQQVNVIQWGDPKAISEKARARNNIQALRQGLLHRSINLAGATNLLAKDGSAHAIALCVRGQMEGAAQLGYFCHRLNALSKGNISFDEFHLGLGQALVASSHVTFKDAPKPINILTCFEKADKHYESELGGNSGTGMLRDSYDWLSNYCHPNCLSSSISQLLDPQKHEITFQHGQPLSKRHAELFGYLAISFPMFRLFWHGMGDRLTLLDGG